MKTPLRRGFASIEVVYTSRIEITLEGSMDYTGKAVIYQIFNTVNSKFYVGSSVQLKTRWRKHRRELNANRHHCPHLQAAWSMYGESVFELRVVQVVSNAADLMLEEQKWLDEHHGKAYCYNYAKYVDSSARGVKFQPAHCQAISESLKKHYAEFGSPNVGRKHTEESKKLISEKKRGVPKTEEHKQKLREANLGKQASKETKAKLSALRKGKVKAPEWVAKYTKQVLEVTSGVVYPSLKVVKETFGIAPGTLNAALKANKPMAKGAHKGKHFRYVDRSEAKCHNPLTETP